jgi:PAS domain S-box-containing protein
MPTDAKNILIVDDSPEDRTYLKHLLRPIAGTDWRFAEADSAAQALAILDKESFDCVFLDQRLPDASGIDTLDRLRSAAGDPKVPVVLLTGVGDETLAANALKAGAMDYLPKHGLTSHLVFHAFLNAIEKFRLLQHLRERADLLELTQDAVIVRDGAGKIAYWNRGAEQLYGYSRDQAVGQMSFKLLQTVFPGPLPEIEAVLQKSEYWEGELIQTASDGRKITVASRWALRRAHGHGSSDLILQIHTDITARKQAQRDLQTAKEVAEAANLAKSEFLAAMSHEIRTPMNAILGVADLLWDSDLNPTQRKYVALFRRAGGNLLTLLNNILDMSKIESGHFELERIDFDLEELVDRTMELIRPKTQAKHIDLICRITPATPTCFVGDPTRLQQILFNLLGNAVKFTERGEITLTIASHAHDPARLSFEVADTGIGIPAGKLATIFDDFTQADSSTTRRFGGTGLGLGICRKLVQRMDGELKVRSEAGSGSVFYFDAVFGAGAHHKAMQPELMVAVAGRRVLIVDNNFTNRLILSEMCAAWGMLPAESGNAEIALVALRDAAQNRQPFDLVIVDRLMPAMDGFELVSKIRGIAPKIPIMMVSSDNIPGDETKAQSMELAGYAVKPVRRAELLRMICDALGEGEHGHRPTPTNAPISSAKPQTSHARILIVDDSEDNRFLFGVYMEGTSYEVTFAEDGQSAVELARSQPFDLIVMDVQMPVMDGLTATKLIRQQEREQGRPEVPVLAVTADARQVDLDASLQAGCTAHLTKPILKNKLLAAIEEHLGAIHPRAVINIPAGLEQAARRYIKLRQDDAPRLAQLGVDQDFEQLRLIAHDIKGTGAAYGFPDLTRLSALIEESARDRNAVQLTQQLMEFSQSVQTAAAAVSALPTGH